MTKSKLNNAEIIASYQKTQAGVLKYWGTAKSILVGGIDTTASKINATLQADVDATNALEAAEADVKQKRAAQREARTTASATRRDLKAFIIGSYGAQAVQMLEDCGFSPPKKGGARTVASKAKAVAASKATREAGGAKAKKAKAQPATTEAAPAAASPATPVK